MQHLEKRANLFYAVLTVPTDVRHLIGKMRFVQSTQTSEKATARTRASLLVAGWKTEITKARGTLPDPKATFWENLRRDFINAPDAGTEFAIMDVAKDAALKMADPAAGSVHYRMVVGKATLLDSLVADWKVSLRLAPKTVDQMHRDVMSMADHFKALEALTPRAVKAWTVKLLAAGSTASTLVRVGGSCRSFWRYLRDSDAVPVDAPDPFAGSFKLAQKAAPQNTVNRQEFTAQEVARLHQAATQGGDTDLANLIALGAFTGARIEELCSLTVRDVADGAFIIRDAKTDAGNRYVPVHPELLPLLESMTRAAIGGFLVPSPTITSLSVGHSVATARKRYDQKRIW